MKRLYPDFLKRCVDFLAAAAALLLLCPLMLILMLILHFANKGAGVFFYQERPGRAGRIFRVIKFKTMTDERDASGQLLPNDRRVTPTGRLMRRLSLDELPQLLNVLKGDMSLVGPRPLLKAYLPMYTPEQSRRHDVRPGITGWAQVNGRNAISWKEKFARDVWYVDNLSFLLDVRILWLTVLKVVRSEGINAADNTFVQPFNGDN